MKRWRYNIGQRWRCTRAANDNPWVNDDFYFIIIAKGTRSDRKLCRSFLLVSLGVNPSSLMNRNTYTRIYRSTASLMVMWR